MPFYLLRSGVQSSQNNNTQEKEILERLESECFSEQRARKEDWAGYKEPSQKRYNHAKLNDDAQVVWAKLLPLLYTFLDRVYRLIDTARHKQHIRGSSCPTRTGSVKQLLYRATEHTIHQIIQHLCLGKSSTALQVDCPSLDLTGAREDHKPFLAS